MNILLIQTAGEHNGNRIYRESYCLQRAFQTMQNITCDVWGYGHGNFNIPINFNNYDVIILLEQRNFNYIDFNKLKLSKAYKIVMAIDSHSLGMNHFNSIKQAGNFNLILCSIKHHVEKDCVWFPNSADTFLMKPLRVNNRADIGFCGTDGGSERLTIINTLKKSFNSNFIFDEFVIGDKMVEAINSYKLHFNFNVMDDINYRNFETIAMGIPLITNYNYQYDELGFQDDKNCIFYTNTDELISKIKHYINIPEKLINIGNNGLELSKKHSWVSRAQHLLMFLKYKI